MARLPIPGADEGSWGQILNDFLSQSHQVDGSLKTGAVAGSAIQDGSISQAKLAATGGTNGQVLITDGTNIGWANVSVSTPDATDSVKGILQLTGDLGGTATSPTVPGLAGKADTIHTHAISDVTNLQSSLNAKEPALTAGTTGQYYRGDKSWQTLDKTTVGLGNVDNTSDADKPISVSTQAVLDNKAALSHSHTASQISDSTATGRAVMIAADATAARTAIGAGTSNLVIGTTSTTAKAGDYAPTKADVGLGSVDNTSDADKPISSLTQAALNAKADALYALNAQTGTSYTLVPADAGKFITLTNAAAITLTVPTNASVAFAVGTRINFVQMGAGQVTVVAAGGVSVFADPGLKIAAQYGGAELVNLATDIWILVGRLAA